jgi:hypothetical protein
MSARDRRSKTEGLTQNWQETEGEKQGENQRERDRGKDIEETEGKRQGEIQKGDRERERGRAVMYIYPEDEGY